MNCDRRGWRVSRRNVLLTTCSLAICGAMSGVAQAQSANPNPPAGEASAAEVGTITVTGSRLTSGFTAPTPVTVITSEQLVTAAPNNIADALNQLPSFTNSTQAQNPITGVTGANGQNILNLRGLGGNRALVLLDGRRLPSTNALGSVDIDVMPQTLVKRVDVVTGGASAAYGSDAVAGVINFVLDTTFEGVKASAQTGISTYGDLPSAQVQLSAGHSFLDGRARLIASTEYFKQDGIAVGKKTDRKWFDVPWGQIPNPAGGTPQILVIPDIRSSAGSNGGLIASGPLKGLQFLPGGALAPFDYGAITGNSFQSGGDGGSLAYGFSPDQKRSISFLHGEYDVSPAVTLYSEAHYSYNFVASRNQINPQVAASDQFTIFSDNAFLPAAVKQRMAAAGVTSIPVGRYEADFPTTVLSDKTQMFRGVIGAKGSLPGTSWKYDLSYAGGRTDQKIFEENMTHNRKIYAAADAVINPANGQIVCRSTLQGLDAGCVPLNIFGVGAPSQAAIAYVTGTEFSAAKLRQQVLQLNLSGDLGDKLQFGAGPISLAGGAEYRKERAAQTTDPASVMSTDETGVRGAPASYQGKQGSYRYFNPLPFSGKYDVKEGYLEAGVPLLKDLPFVKALNVDGAFRYTDYSQSGGVSTWKVGVNYEVNDFRFQYTRSRDIRAPNMLELFNGGTALGNNFVYGGKTVPGYFITTGNVNLKPERAITWTSGITFSPSWFRGFRTALNYYDIKISDAIGTNSAQYTIDQCNLGNQALCGNITLTPSNTLIIYTPNVNLSVLEKAGVDFEADYTTGFAGGSLNFRALTTLETKDYTQTPGSAPRKNLGSTTSPMWRGAFQVRYKANRWSLFLQERFIGAAKMDPTRQEGVYTNNNHVPAALYTDATATFSLDGGKGGREAFLSINNLLNRDPPIATSNPTNNSYPSSVVYDRIGRYFTFGIRFVFD